MDHYAEYCIVLIRHMGARQMSLTRTRYFWPYAAPDTNVLMHIFPQSQFSSDRMHLIAQCPHVGKRNNPQYHLSLLPLHKLVFFSHLGDNGLQIYYHLIPCK